jgi:hypothetical protein
MKDRVDPKVRDGSPRPKSRTDWAIPCKRCCAHSKTWPLTGLSSNGGSQEQQARRKEPPTRTTGGSQTRAVSGQSRSVGLSKKRSAVTRRENDGDGMRRVFIKKVQTEGVCCC